MILTISSQDAIKRLVQAAVKAYANGFETRHVAEHGNPNGTINMKIHNVFISALGPEIQYYTALVRSLDSSLGNMLEGLAMDIASLFYEVKHNVEGPLTVEQTKQIAELLETYRRREKKPRTTDYLFLREPIDATLLANIRHDSDYYLLDKTTRHHYLIELKIGGDLDNKKARSEKEAILEQYAILSNTIKSTERITIYFATAYNRFGEEEEWKQERVRQFFANDELLIGKAFWNFICKSDTGYETVLSTYKDYAYLIKAALTSIKELYLKPAV